MGKNIWQQFQTDKKAEQEGIWIDFGDYEWLCARAGGSNVKFKEAFAKKTKKIQEQMELEDLPDDKGREILYQTFADTVVLDWKGMVDQDGNEWPFEKENVIQVFNVCPDFFDELRSKLMARNLFLADLEQAAIKN